MEDKEYVTETTIEAENEVVEEKTAGTAEDSVKEEAVEETPVAETEETKTEEEAVSESPAQAAQPAQENKPKDLTAYNNRFREDPTSFNDYQASDYVRELKNQGQEDKAIEVGRTFREQAPELKRYVNYFGYALYNRYINIPDSAIAENEDLFYQILGEIAEVCHQERYSPLEASVNKAIKYITKKNDVDYAKLNEVLDLLDAPTLDATPFTNKSGKEFESKKEKWYRLKVRALYETGQYTECLEQANIALSLTELKWHYNNLSWVKYYRGCALLKLQRYEEAENEFIALKDRFRAVSFSDLLFELYVNTDRKNEAYTQACYDFFREGFDYHYMGTYEQIRQMAADKGQERAERLVTAMMKKLAEENDATFETELDLSEFDGETASNLYDKLYNAVMFHLSDFIERQSGRVVFYNENKNFGSITGGNEERVFFRQADFIEDEIIERYDDVEFSVIKTFDFKRQEPSTKAILLRTV